MLKLEAYTNLSGIYKKLVIQMLRGNIHTQIVTFNPNDFCWNVGLAAWHFWHL